LDDKPTTGRQKGKQGWDASGKTYVLIAYESSDKKQGLSLCKLAGLHAT
jgi:hypothetical protein